MLFFALGAILVVAAASAAFYVISQPRAPSGPGAAALNTATPASGTTATQLAPTDTSTPAPTATPTPAPPQLTFNAQASVDMDGLHIQTSGVACPAQLVLKQQQYAYDNNAIQQMQTYLSAFAQVTAYGTPRADSIFAYTQALANQLPPVPDTLQWVPGGANCFGELDFTNTGNQSVQITSIGLAFDADATPNSYGYQLIDICSVLGKPYPPPTPVPADSCGQNGQSGGGCVYAARFSLQGGSAGTQVNSAIDNSNIDSCPLPVTLDPTQPTVQKVNLYFKSTLAQELYRIRLTVTIATASGTQVLILPSAFTSTLAFASGQFSCYHLSGNTFSQEALPGDPTVQGAFPCL